MLSATKEPTNFQTIDFFAYFMTKQNIDTFVLYLQITCIMKVFQRYGVKI